MLYAALMWLGGMTTGIGLYLMASNLPGRRHVNIVRGILLPNPSDERWGASEKCGNGGADTCPSDKCFRVLRLGAIAVHHGGLVKIDGVKWRGRGFERYARATFRAQAERRALTEATGE